HESKSDIISKSESQTELKPEVTDKELTSISFYDLFLIKLKNIMKDKELKLKEIKNSIDINPSQFNDWLKKAEADDIIEKLTNPVRYKIKSEGEQQASLFN
ncbi:MAG TPA: hypothetical protein PK073_06350, partial [Ignavibacteriaceae bacterium]|nr:hypothetical protein [Ignavibacteriaceae bacterium]